MVIFMIHRLHVIQDATVKCRRIKLSPEILDLELDTIMDVFALKYV